MRKTMLRGFASAGAALAVCAVFGLSAEAAQKAPKPVYGVIKTVDPATGALTVTIKVKKESKDMDYTLDDSAKVVVYATPTDKKELAGKDGLKNEEVKIGANVGVLADASGKVTELDVGKIPKPKTAKGKLKKVDADAGVVTVTVKKKKQDTDVDFKVDDATKVLIYTADQPMKFTGKDGLKNDALKEGVDMAVVTSPEGKVTQVRVGTPPKK
ncbi:MAG TPA: hypothetical protein VMS17_27575 [Gemmataceae bacterium]|nr:hypothetical protein [Gemmataceae bacterium]